MTVNSPHKHRMATSLPNRKSWSALLWKRTKQEVHSQRKTARQLYRHFVTAQL